MYNQPYNPLAAPPGTYGVGSSQAGQQFPGGAAPYGQSAPGMYNAAPGGAPPPGNYGAPPGGYGGAPPGGYGAPPPGGYGGPPPGGYGGPPGGSAADIVGMGGPPPGGNYGPPPGGYGGPPPGGNYGPPPGGYGGPPPGGPPPGGYGGPPPGQYGAPPPGQYGAGPPPGQYGAGPPPGQYGAGPPPGQYNRQGSGSGYGGGSSSNKRAVLVGINYLRHSKGRLRGCINDVKSMNQFLLSRGYRQQDIRILTDDLQDPSMQPTKANIMRELSNLARGARPGDKLFFHFSGHGSQVVDTSGDEDDGLDETILPVDYNSAGQIIDDDLYSTLVEPLPPGCQLTALMDCCHSGTGLDLPYVHNIAPSYGDSGKKKKKKKLKKKKKKKNYGAPTDLPGTTRGDIYLYSGCRDDQTSADASFGGEASGAMTWAFTSSLRQNANQSFYGLLLSMRDLLNSGKGPRTFTQVPQLSTGRRIDVQAPFNI